MTINELGSLGEFIGSIGIVVTLIYLAIEIRQNTRSMDEGRKLALVDAMLRRNDVIERSAMQSALSETILEIRTRAISEGVHSLSDVERARLRSYEVARVVRIEGQYYQWKHGLIDEDDLYELFGKVVENNWRLWQELGVAHGRREFRQAVDEIANKLDLRAGKPGAREAPQ